MTALHVAQPACIFLDLVRSSQWPAKILLTFILIRLGEWIVGHEPRMHTWGLRLAIGVFAAYVGYSCYEIGSPDAGDLVMFVLQGMIGAGLVLGVSWIGLAILAFLFRTLLARPLDMLRKRHQDLQRQWKDHQDDLRREQVLQRQREQWELDAPLRAEAQRQADILARAEAQAQKRREDARAACEMLYQCHALEIRQRFPRSKFDEFIQKYMGDARSPDDVDERSMQLQEMIRQHVEKVEPPPKFQTLGDAAAWFQAQETDIQKLSDDKFKRVLLAQLKGRYTDIVSKLFEEIGA